ncbi:MAG: membrane protein insertion efficiency factor YidD [Pseudomonadota bacterium]|nr:membrane protein insertion efficiency factor YidD [Pseudomonadota bacterium]
MITKLLIGMIDIYQRFFSLLFGSNCRFCPTCSHYLKEAIQLHGPIKGMMLGINRLSKCHPWHEGGMDLVPDPASHPELKS